MTKIKIRASDSRWGRTVTHSLDLETGKMVTSLYIIYLFPKHYHFSYSPHFTDEETVWVKHMTSQAHIVRELRSWRPCLVLRFGTPGPGMAIRLHREFRIYFHVGKAMCLPPTLTNHCKQTKKSIFISTIIRSRTFCFLTLDLGLLTLYHKATLPWVIHQTSWRFLPSTWVRRSSVLVSARLHFPVSVGTGRQ